MTVALLLRMGLAAACVAAGGCAGYKLTAISPQDADDAHLQGRNTEGYTFYEPAVYIVVGPVETGKPTVQVFTLPDYERPYRFTRYEFLAKSELEIAFEEGWRFTGAKSSTDSTAVPAAIVSLLEQIPFAGRNDSKEPRVFRLVRRPGPDGKVGVQFERVDLGMSSQGKVSLDTARTATPPEAERVENAPDAGDALRERICGTPVPPLATRAAVAARIAPALAAERLEKPAEEPTVIKVRFHVLHDGTQGNVDDAVLLQQIDVLNADFGSSGVTFQALETSRTNDARLFRMGYGSPEEVRAKTTLGRDQQSSLNMYLCSPGQGLLGWATFPWDLAANPTMDGIVVDFRTLPGGTAPFDGGRTATHEVGHWLGLYHTFQGGCAPPGDEVSDTPAQALPTSGCPVGKDTCVGSGPDPIHNYMDYSHDACMNQFTREQDVRMRAMLRTYRPAIR